MSTDALMQRASERTGGLSDFGPNGWQEGLEHLVRAVLDDLGDHADAVTRIEEIIVGRLVVRLQVEDWYSRRGHEVMQPVEGPLVIIGLPRTGTTALHYLLATDQRFRYPRRWEAKDPVPPDDRVADRDDARRARSRAGASVRHIASIDGPAEDGPIHAFDFRSGELVLGVPSYTRWWRQADHTTAFAYHDRVLRLMHTVRPPHHWLLKLPAYLFQLPQLAAQYPQARFVWTHRDPVAALPSTCSTIVDSLRQRLPDLSPDPRSLGQEMLEHFATGVDRAIDARRELGETRFLDVGQPGLEVDPIGTAERIYEFAGLDLDNETRTAMGSWVAENRRGSRGEHRYSPEDYGLTPDGIRQSYAGYITRYGELFSGP